MKKFMRFLITLTLITILTIFLYNNYFYDTNTNETTKPVDKEFIELKYKTININNIKTNNYLELVNNTNKVNSNISTNIKLSPVFELINSTTNDIFVDERIQNSLIALMSQAKKDGYLDFMLTSGYRTNLTQTNLYNTAVDKSYVQKPGYSEHQTGLAVDIGYKGLSGSTMVGSKPSIWLEANAYKYGFTLRYPKDKVSITNISYEPWHYRYVGIQHAYYMKNNSLCLEEYIDLLKNSDKIDITVEKKDYTIYYEKPVNGTIKVPVDNDYTVSTDNTGGYIVTVSRS